MESFEDVGEEPELQSGSLSEVQYNWVEITDDFKSACKNLELGQLVHDEQFTLFEAMSAIEMMDSKMDAGMMCHKVNRKVLSLQEAVADGGLKVDNFEIDELVGLIDDTLSCLCTWLDGHSLVQTVFTNLYLHDPNIIVSSIWKAFCIFVLKFVDNARDWINRANVFEEEDIQPLTYGFNLMSDLSDTRACGMLKEAEEETQRNMRAAKSRSDEKITLGHQAVYVRIKLCRLLLTVLTTFNYEKRHPTMYEDAGRLLNQQQELLKKAAASIRLGAVAKPRPEPVTSHDYSTLPGFEPLANQRLLPPTFPRYTQIMSRSDCYEYLSSFVSRLQQICGLSNLSDYVSALDFTAEFSKQSPCVLSRSVLQLLVLSPSRKLLGIVRLEDALRDYLKSFMPPLVLLPKGLMANQPQARECVESLLQHAARCMSELICNSGHNRARQRERCAHLLAELANLADEAEKVDGYVTTLQQSLVESGPRQQISLPLGACCGTWVLSTTLRVMFNYLMAGFELELYAPYEFASVFFYLAEFIAQWRLNTIYRSERYMTEVDQYQERLNKAQATSGSKKRASTSKKHRKPRKPNAQLVMTQAIQMLCNGLFKAMMAFENEGRIKQPDFKFANQEVRYNHRFSPFSCLATPPVVTFAHYRNLTAKLRPPDCMSVPDIYKQAGRDFQVAKETLESVSDSTLTAEVQALQRVAKTNMVVVNLLASGLKKDVSTPSFDFTIHRNFPIIKLK